jgi:uncharacterized lipoprotein
MRMGRVLWVAVAGACLLSSCSWMRRGNDSCREPPVPANTENRPPLKAPAGLVAPDTRNAVKVPALTEPERPRSKSHPCLSLPPSYGS